MDDDIVVVIVCFDDDVEKMFEVLISDKFKLLSRCLCIVSFCSLFIMALGNSRYKK
jgi:hypothetical protein